MTDRMECLLDDCLTVHLKEIRKICKDKTNNQVMCKSNITAVDFDKISRKYCKKKGVPSFPCTVDAMYISMNGQWYLIEFKMVISISYRYIVKFMIALLCYWN